MYANQQICLPRPRSRSTSHSHVLPLPSVHRMRGRMLKCTEYMFSGEQGRLTSDNVLVRRRMPLKTRGCPTSLPPYLSVSPKLTLQCCNARSRSAETSTCTQFTVFAGGKPLSMADSSDTMAPLMPLSSAPSLIKRTPDDLLPKLEVHVGTINATAPPNGPTQMPQDSGLQTKANDNTQEDWNGLESKVSPMTTAITLQIFGMNVFLAPALFCAN